ncbi:hypothetical protein GCM10009744_05330 [Kribbella alba]|uniref:Uncharacterized protein n=1 Tax=Kribbella alba TaxID=190197 RepID=A0ABP4QW38_9ACTN
MLVVVVFWGAAGVLLSPPHAVSADRPRTADPAKMAKRFMVSLLGLKFDTTHTDSPRIRFNEKAGVMVTI